MSKSKLANDENSERKLMSQVEAQQQKLNALQERINQLEERRKALIEQNDKKQEKLNKLKNDIKKWKEEENPIVRQLRDHYKQLRQQLGDAIFDDQDSQEEDDIDLDNMSYEQLLELGQKIGTVSKGLSSQKFNQLPRIKAPANEQCSICRDDFEQQQCVMLPCGHYFHEECLKMWCTQQKICPNCKAQIV